MASDDLTYRETSAGDLPALVELSSELNDPMESLSHRYLDYCRDEHWVMLGAFSGDQMLGFHAARVVDGGTAGSFAWSRTSVSARNQGIFQRLCKERRRAVLRRFPSVKRWYSTSINPDFWDRQFKKKTTVRLLQKRVIVSILENGDSVDIFTSVLDYIRAQCHGTIDQEITLKEMASLLESDTNSDAIFSQGLLPVSTYVMLASSDNLHLVNDKEPIQLMVLSRSPDGQPVGCSLGFPVPCGFGIRYDMMVYGKMSWQQLASHIEKHLVVAQEMKVRDVSNTRIGVFMLMEQAAYSSDVHAAMADMGKVSGVEAHVPLLQYIMEHEDSD